VEAEQGVSYERASGGVAEVWEVALSSEDVSNKIAIKIGILKNIELYINYPALRAPLQNLKGIRLTL